MTAEAGEGNGPLAAAISTAVVRTLAEATGRGPTKARTTLGENGVFVVLEDTLTRGEQTLTDAGYAPAVLNLRRDWQRVMETELRSQIEALTGRRVIGFMSDNHIDPDLAVEVFVLEPRTRESQEGTPAAVISDEPVNARATVLKPRENS